MKKCYFFLFLVFFFLSCSGMELPSTDEFSQDDSTAEPTTDIVAEICDNTIDDDSNGAVDCDDAACSSSSSCVEAPAESGAPISSACADGEIIAITSSSQDSDSVTEGESVNLSILACSGLGLSIDYAWYLEGHADDILSTENTYVFQTDSSFGGQSYTIVGKAYIDSNNYVTQNFTIEVVNIDYLNKLAEYSFESPDDDSSYQAFSIEKYGNYLLIGLGNVMTSAADGYVEIVDVSDKSAPDYEGYFTTTNNPELLLNNETLFVQGCYKEALPGDPSTSRGEVVMIYDLAAGFTNPALQSTTVLQRNPGCFSSGYMAMNDTSDTLYVNYSSFIDIYGITDLTSPSLYSAFRIGSASGDATGTCLKYYDNHIFLIGENEVGGINETSIHVRDVSDPTNVQELDSLKLGDGWGYGYMFQSLEDPSLLYTTTSDQVDISDPTAVFISNEIQGLDLNPTDIFVYNNLLYSNNTHGPVYIYDISDFGNVVRVGDLDTGEENIVAYFTDDIYLYVLKDSSLLIYQQ